MTIFHPLTHFLPPRLTVSVTLILQSFIEAKSGEPSNVLEACVIAEPGRALLVRVSRVHYSQASGPPCMTIAGFCESLLALFR